MGDFESLKLVCPAACFFPEWAEVGAVDLVLALHLLDHQFRVGDDAQAALLVFQAPGEDAQKGGVFSVVVGALAEVLAEPGEYAAVLVFDNGAIAGRAGVAAGASVAVGYQDVI